ncbi:hypothetical protein vseg_010846 [Gypsophila vaccaria]
MRRSSRRSSMAVSLHHSLDSDSYSYSSVSSRRSSFFDPPLDEPRNLAGNFTTKFSMSSFIKRVEDLTPQQHTAIESVGFGKVLRIPHHTLRKNLLVEWIERWDCEKQAFLLLGRELTITPLDVALILGLRATGMPVTIKLDEPYSELEQAFGADRDSRKISISSIEARLQSLGTSADEDFVRTFLLFTFGTLLFHNSNGKVDSRYLSVLHDITKVSNYAWGVAVVEDLFNSLSRRKEEQNKGMDGCLILLQIWSYEHLDIGRPNLLSEASGFPRACRWESRKFNATRHFITTKFNQLDEDQVVWKLQPVGAELSIQIVKELLEKTEAVIQQLPKATRTSTQGMGLPPKRVSQRVLMNEVKKVKERGGKHDFQTECPETSCLSTDVSEVAMDHRECSSSYGTQEALEDQVVNSSRGCKGDNCAFKTENTKLKKVIVELKREADALRKELIDVKEENTNLRSAAAFIDGLERFTHEFDELLDDSQDNSL